MPEVTGPFRPRDGDLVIRFGAGLNSRATPADIDEQECAAGENYDLDIDNRDFRRRAAFSLVGTATNGGDLRGMGQLKDSSGTLTQWVQAGDTVYSWDGATSFTSKATVSSSAQLRGTIWQLDDLCLISDLNAQEVVMTWDGSSIADMSHNLGGDFKARYIAVENERAWYANVLSGSALPHVIVGSKISDYDNLSINDRPASTATAGDPFFIATPDLKAVNGFIQAFGLKVVSTSNGRLYKITGTDITDFAIDQFYDESFASGAEAIVAIGNDVAIASEGRIETLYATQNLGDVEIDDLTRKIQPDVESLFNWTLAFNRNNQKLYAFANSHSTVYVMHKAFIDDQIRRVAQRAEAKFVSPWSRWKTDHAMAFQPSCVVRMLRPSDGLPTVYMGGSAGQIYELDGDATGDDGGTTAITASRTSKLYRAPLGKFDRITGYVVTKQFSQTADVTITLTAQWAGTQLFDQLVQIVVSGATGIPAYGGSDYYGGGSYYGIPFTGRLTAHATQLIGAGSHFQLKVDLSGAEDLEVEEVILRLETS